LLTHV